MLAAAVGVPGLGRAGEGEGVQGPQRHRVESRTASCECYGEWAGLRGAPARALGGRSEPAFLGGPERGDRRGEEAARAHASRSLRPARSQRPGSSRVRGAAGQEAALDRLLP